MTAYATQCAHSRSMRTRSACEVGIRKAARALESETAWFAFGIGLIIDEVLSVGDEAFQKKWSLRMEEFRRQGLTGWCT